MGILTLETNKYAVKLDNFEGPLDLLVHLIDKNKLDIYDIRITDIADQYIDYINQMERMNLDVTSEFLVIASTLVYLKSKELLPKEVDDEAELKAMIDQDPIEAFNRMRCLETAYKAKLKKLEYQEEAKQLYRFEDICRDLSEVFTVIRGELLAIPQRVAGRCEGRDTREIEEILDNEINSALEHIQKSKFAEKCPRSSSS